MAAGSTGATVDWAAAVGPVPSIACVQVGDVVSLRVVTRAGPTDVVGTLVAVSADTVELRRRDGEVTQITRASIAAGRVVPPGPAQRVTAAELQQVMAAGWRAAEVAALGDWLLRAASGFTGRADSVLPVGDPGLPLGAAIDRVQQWYDERGLPPRVQLPDQGAAAGLAAALDSRGWTRARPTQVMTSELGPVLRGGSAASVGVRLDERPDEAWLAAFRPDEGRDDTSEQVIREVLTNHPTVAFASVRDGDRCLAIARVAVDGRWAGLSCVEVVPDRRHTGLATAVNLEALRWAVSHRARRAYLQVVVGNDSARAVYDRLGFRVHHEYEYRSAPAAS